MATFLESKLRIIISWLDLEVVSILNKNLEDGGILGTLHLFFDFQPTHDKIKKINKYLKGENYERGAKDDI